MQTDNDRTGMLITDLCRRGYRPEFQADGDGVIVTMRQLRRGMLGGVTTIEIAGADPATVLELAMVQIRGASDVE